MAITKEEIRGTKIINEIKSSNIKGSVYDTQDKTLLIEFNNGSIYQYSDVPHQEYTKFRIAKSQGTFFSNEISKKYKYRKL